MTTTPAPSGPSPARADGATAPLTALIARLPTGMKMLLILSMALLPLGIIALLASLQTAQINRMRRIATIQVIAIDSADRLDLSLTRTTLALRAAGVALTENSASAASCRHTLAALTATPGPAMRIAIFDRGGGLLCATRGFRPAQPPVAAGPQRVTLLAGGNTLRLVAVSPDGAVVALADLPRETIAAIAHPRVANGAYDLALSRGGVTMALAQIRSPPLGRSVPTTVPVASGQLLLTVTLIAAPVSASEALMILLPILMWIAAAATGWLVMDRLVLRPLAILQGAVDAYRAGDARMRLPPLTTPAREMRRLGEAFRGMAGTVAGHEAELEEGLARQTKLTREVHHRVKNNLQVVASLLSLHARGAQSAETAAAYAAIQRRVDALAIVHRSHYAELEANQGVALRPLIAELAANLRASVPSEIRPPTITVDLKPFYATQDVAVSVAFLVTELVELPMICTPGARVAILLEGTAEPGRAALSIQADALREDGCADAVMLARFSRVVEGLSRQLRAKMARDPAGRMTIEIMVNAAADPAAPEAAAIVAARH